MKRHLMYGNGWTIALESKNKMRKEKDRKKWFKEKKTDFMYYKYGNKLRGWNVKFSLHSFS